MSIFLVTNPESPYYESEAFDKLLGFIQSIHANARFANRTENAVS